VAYVPHWMLGVVDGGPGHCFPSGHAVTALCFFGVYFGWRRQWPVAARRALALTLLAAAVLGATQLVRGAHFASHTLWSAWLCGSACAVMDAVWRLRGRAPLQQAG
jgi:membrane-associated PAP2 superfamily phosphatase